MNDPSTVSRLITFRWHYMIFGTVIGLRILREPPDTWHGNRCWFWVGFFVLGVVVKRWRQRTTHNKGWYPTKGHPNVKDGTSDARSGTLNETETEPKRLNGESLVPDSFPNTRLTNWPFHWGPSSPRPRPPLCPSHPTHWFDRWVTLSHVLVTPEKTPRTTLQSFLPRFFPFENGYPRVGRH